MKNNLLKTIAVIAIAVAMLATTVTSFAATATTVTTYSEDATAPHVVSTVSDVPQGVMVTYLASKNGTVSSKDDIVYIGQATSDGSTLIEFEYDALANPTAQILYGSNLADVATALNGDAPVTISASGVEITVDAGVESYSVIDSEEKDITDTKILGSTEDGTLNVTLKAGYELASVTVNGVDVENPTSAISVKAGDVVVVNTVDTSCPVNITAITVDEDDIDKVVMYDAAKSKNGAYTVDDELDYEYLLCQITAGAEQAEEFGVYAKNADGTGFELEDNGTTGGYYPAIGATDGYYAVLLAAEDMSGVTLIPYCKYNGEYVKFQ